MRKILKTRALRYGIIGALFGLAYTMAGFTIEKYVGENGALIFIEIAPVLFGVLAFAIGREEDGVRRQAAVLDAARERFASLTHTAVIERNWDVNFYDSHIPTCWEVKNCTYEDCPSYGEHHVRCWLVSGTHCRGEVQGQFANKLGDCARCEIYQAAVGRDPISEIAENFNSLMWSLREKEDELADANEEMNRQYAELKELQEKTREMAESDALTGLRNHGHFQEHLLVEVGRARRYGRSLAVMMMDLDHFKEVNDRFGHQKGDAVLACVGEMLGREVRDADYVARYGGEEFVIIMPETTAAEAVNFAERIRTRMDRVALSADLPAEFIGASFGIADLPVCATDGASLVAAADSALLFSKRKGRNRVSYFKDLSDTDLEEGDLDRLNSRLEGVCFQTIRALAEAVDARDNYTAADATLINDVASRLADSIGMDRERTNALTLAARLHDIGKISVPDAVLGKKGKLTPEEVSVVRRHPEAGKRIVEEAEHLQELVAAILYHHERWDGKGYPEGLKGEEIPVMARAIGIIDAYRAMATDRPYRQAMNSQQIIEELRKGAGSQFDPQLVELFITVLEENRVRNIRQVS